MIRKINILTFITACVFLWGGVGKGAAFQDMICKSLLSDEGKPTKCNTFMLDEERARIACGGQPLENNSGVCTIVISLSVSKIHQYLMHIHRGFGIVSVMI